MPRHVKCPGCERILCVPKSNSRDVQMRCKHCDTPFLASLMGHIDLEETQMATSSKKAAEAATKAKATAPAKKATAAPTKKATSAPAPSKKVKAEPGYKGHLKGSKKGDMHKFFDSMKSPDAVKFLAKCEGVGLKKSTASSWFGAFKKSA